MNIIIIGASDLGAHIAAVLSAEEHNVTLVDKDGKKLEKISQDLDIAIIQGSGTDWQLLEELIEVQPDLLLALTDNDEANLVICSMAKNLRYPQTVARVRRISYLNCTRLDFNEIFSVDHFIAPEYILAQEIFKFMVSPQAISGEGFAHGTIHMNTIVVPAKWRKEDKKLWELNLPEGVMAGLIKRINKDNGTKQIIFPHGYDTIKPGDAVSFIGEADAINEVYHFFGMSPKKLLSAVIIGGSLTGFNLAKILQHKQIHTTIIDQDYDRCNFLADHLPHSTILHHNATDLKFLHSEQIGSADVIVACTDNDENNILCASLGKKAGCDRAIALITNTAFIPILEELQIDHYVSPRISITNRILSILQKEKITAVSSIYENQAKIMEIKVSIDSPLAGIPISELGPYLPKDFLFAAIQNRGRIMIANGSRILCPGDTVIVISHPQHSNELQKLF